MAVFWFFWAILIVGAFACAWSPQGNERRKPPEILDFAKYKPKR